MLKCWKTKKNVQTLRVEGIGTALIVISLAPVLTILARVLAINLNKAMALQLHLIAIAIAFYGVPTIPGSSPGPVNHKIDGVGDKVPDAEVKTQQTRHKPHSEHKQRNINFSM